ncbi:hypothetical protein CEXT_190631 [Caerostris extrusa]|uniref:Uncharacterized protein n=1 Tax=Caerostris extrusa TaxID=172846 RepID=A0AAV4MHV4_CAEEX|nr:hypothetical protein CEXT_190631 [Caerostris extrusa]
MEGDSYSSRCDHEIMSLLPPPTQLCPELLNSQHLQNVNEPTVVEDGRLQRGLDVRGFDIGRSLGWFCMQIMHQMPSQRRLA